MTQTLPTALQYVDYDSRTDVIDPRGKVYDGYASVRAVLGHDGYEVRKPVVGWGEMTHLIQPGNGGWALARIP
jgi:hypothetical protein